MDYGWWMGNMNPAMSSTLCFKEGAILIPIFIGTHPPW